MMSRASIGNPWFFKQVKHYFKTGRHLEHISMPERVEAARRHLKMSIDWKGEVLEFLKLDAITQIILKEYQILSHIEQKWLQVITARMCLIRLMKLKKSFEITNLLNP